MPLITNDIEQARTAYRALEARALSAERHVKVLQDRLAELTAKPAPPHIIPVLRDHILRLEAENIRLRNQADEAARLKTDVSLQNLIQAFSLAAAVGEASMPDRAIASLSATVSAHIVPDSAGAGIRFQPPELGGIANGLSETCFVLAKAPPQVGAATPRNLYVVLEDKQRIYADPLWARFEQARHVVGAIVKILADTGTWSFRYLLQEAASLAELEKSLASAVNNAMPGELSSAYGVAVGALTKLTDALGKKPNPVAGDLLALSAALDATTRAAGNFLR